MALTLKFVAVAQHKDNGVIWWRSKWEGSPVGPFQSERETARRRRRLLAGQIAENEVLGSLRGAVKVAAAYVTPLPVRTLEFGYTTPRNAPASGRTEVKQLGVIESLREKLAGLFHRRAA